MPQHVIKSKSPSGVYIPSIDAKDIYLSEHLSNPNPIGYNLRNKAGQYNLKKFVNTFDYSLDLIQLYDIYPKRLHKHDFFFTIKDKQYCTNVINMTFKYTVKDWNQVNKTTFIKQGYDYSSLVFNDCIALNSSHEIVGIQTEQNVSIIQDSIDTEYFTSKSSIVTDKENPSIIKEQHKCYTRTSKPFKSLVSSSQLRTELYKNGFTCNGKHYVRMKRSSGSARVGKCLFIIEELYKSIFKYSSKGLTITPGQEIDLAAFESYLALSSSSIIGTIDIPSDSILVIDDYDSVFKENVIETRSENGHLVIEEKEATITNSIWDGQSLLDISMFGQYSQYGMLLLRNLMFKSCCFNCNIQKWFADNNITEISQLNGYTNAKDIKDIKMITTPNSIKYLKFGSLKQWLKNLYPTFGVVKHDKKTHFFEGHLVQTHYQLLNTLQFTKDEMKEFLAPSFDFINKLYLNPEVVRYYIKYPDIDEMQPLCKPMQNKNDVVYNLLCINDNFCKTSYYQSFLHDLIKSTYSNMRLGHVFVNGNYSTLCGNPIEMLQSSIHQFNGDSQIGTGNIHSTRFDYDKTILGSRSPHVTVSNVWLPHNMANEMIDTYMNPTSEIVYINSINENVLQRLSGCDFDSDTVMLTDNKYLVSIAQRNYDTFKPISSAVVAKKIKRHYTPEEQADLDIKTSVNLIGEIINLSQELNSIMWDKLAHGKTFDDIKDLYYDICQLDVMSGIEIDKAKKEFDVNNKTELKLMRDKYVKELTTIEGKMKLPYFFEHVSKKKGYYNPDKKDYSKLDTSMDYLNELIVHYRRPRDESNGRKVGGLRHVPKMNDNKLLPFASILNSKKYYTYHVNVQQIQRIYDYCIQYTNSIYHLSTIKDVIDGGNYYNLKQLQYNILNDQISDERIGYSTMYQLLLSVESDDKYKKIKPLLLGTLFSCKNQGFIDAIISSKDNIKQISISNSNNTEAMKIFNIPFSIEEKSIKI